MRRLRRRAGAPIVVVWTVAGFTKLEEHVRLGHDYLVPPFLPALVGARLHSCSERAGLGRTLREADARAELMGYEKELEIGREIQAGFLPESLPVPDGWEIDVCFRPARQVAGDFYDVFELSRGRRLAVVVADVCDKGVGAALFMALIRSLLRHTAENSGLQHLMAAGRTGGSRRTPVVGATPCSTPSPPPTATSPATTSDRGTSPPCSSACSTRSPGASSTSTAATTRPCCSPARATYPSRWTSPDRPSGCCPTASTPSATPR